MVGGILLPPVVPRVFPQYPHPLRPKGCNKTLLLNEHGPPPVHISLGSNVLRLRHLGVWRADGSSRGRVRSLGRRMVGLC